MPATAAVLLLALLVGSPYFIPGVILPRAEEIDYSLFPLVMWARQLLHGSAPQWNSTFGLGVPWPIPHTMSHTPFVWLFAIVPVLSALGILVVGHSAFQGYYLLRIVRERGYSPGVSTAVVVTVMLGAPLEYLLQSDAAAVFVAWTLLPAVLYYLFRLMEQPTAAEAPRRTYAAAAALGLVVGYGLLNSHAGVFLAQLLGLGVWALLQPRRLWERRLALALSLLVACAVGADKILMFGSELRYFPTDLVRLQYGVHGSTAHSAWNLFAKPFTMLGGGMEHLVGANLISRTLTFGCFVFGWMACAGTVWAVAQRHSRASRLLVGAFAIDVFLSFLPKAFLPSAFSASWTFRDPAILLGVLLIADFCERVLRPRLDRRVFVGIMVAQTAGAVSSGLIFLYGNQFAPAPGGQPVRLYNDLTDAARTTNLDVLLDRAMRCDSVEPRCASAGRRYAISGIAMMSAQRGHDVDSGFLTNVGPLHGFEDVSALAKGISLDAIHPSQSLPYGLITGDRFQQFQIASPRFDWTADDRSLLDFLGIRAIVAPVTSGPVGEPPVGMLRSRPVATDLFRLAVFPNRDAFPRAFFVDTSRLALVRPRVGCTSRALTCLDVASLTSHTRPWEDPIQVQGADDQILMTMIPRPGARTVLVTMMWRPGWHAWAGTTPIEVVPQWGILRLTIPPGVAEVRLSYHSIAQGLARALTILSIVGCLLGLAVAASVGRRPTGRLGSSASLSGQE
jgi:hypothetical protein